MSAENLDSRIIEAEENLKKLANYSEEFESIRKRHVEALESYLNSGSFEQGRIIDETFDELVRLSTDKVTFYDVLDDYDDMVIAQHRLEKIA